MKPLIIIQARLGSTRLPGKVLMPLLGWSMLEFMIQRLIDRLWEDPLIVVATPDGQIANLVSEWGADAIIGPEDDVAERFRLALRMYETPTFIRLCADSPLMDPALIDAAIALYEPPYLEIRSPVGCVEVCDTKVFLDNLPFMSAHEREHVTLRLRPAGRTISVGVGDRLVVDIQEDLDRVRGVVEKMTRPHTEYGWRECVSLL